MLYILTLHTKYYNCSFLWALPSLRHVCGTLGGLVFHTFDVSQRTQMLGRMLHNNNKYKSMLCAQSVRFSYVCALCIRIPYAIRIYGLGFDDGCRVLCVCNVSAWLIPFGLYIVCEYSSIRFLKWLAFSHAGCVCVCVAVFGGAVWIVRPFSLYTWTTLITIKVNDQHFGTAIESARQCNRSECEYLLALCPIVFSVHGISLTGENIDAHACFGSTKKSFVANSTYCATLLMGQHKQTFERGIGFIFYISHLHQIQIW